MGGTVKLVQDIRDQLAHDTVTGIQIRRHVDFLQRTHLRRLMEPRAELLMEN